MNYICEKLFSMPIRILTFLILIVTMTVVPVKGQYLSPVLLSSSGSTFHTTDITISWSLGELAVSTVRSNEWMLTQGFHQPPLVEEPNSIGKKTETGLSVSVFPNPCRNRIFITCKGISYHTIRYQIHTIQNRLVCSNSISTVSGSEPFEIPVNHLTPGLYILNIMQPGTLPVRIKFIKL